MNKYLTVFSASLENEFVYRLNFVLWRFRNILRFLMTYFLWRGIYSSNQNLFGYSQTQMLTYVFMVLIVQAIVTSSPSSDNIGSEIANGDLSNYLVKPIGYLKYWFTRDLSSKVLNLTFAFFEIFLLWLIFRPALIFPSNILSLFEFLISCGLAIMTYYLMNACSRFMAFWTPENTWGLGFVILVFMELLAGGIFPLNVLPPLIYSALQLTPFPYMVYFPIAIFNGKIIGFDALRILIQSGIWLAIMYWLCKLLWRKGLKSYQSYGR